MANIKRDMPIVGKGKATMKTVAASALSHGKGKRTQSEVVAKAFATASMRTGTFTSKYGK